MSAGLLFLLSLLWCSGCHWSCCCWSRWCTQGWELVADVRSSELVGDRLEARTMKRRRRRRMQMMKRGWFFFSDYPNENIWINLLLISPIVFSFFLLLAEFVRRLRVVSKVVTDKQQQLIDSVITVSPSITTSFRKSTEILKPKLDEKIAKYEIIRIW